MAQASSRTPISNKRCTLEVPEDWRGLWSDGTARRCVNIVRFDVNQNKNDALSAVTVQIFRIDMTPYNSMTHTSLMNFMVSTQNYLCKYLQYETSRDPE